MKKCFKCDSEKPFTDFRKDKSRKDGYNVTCTLCISSANKERYARNHNGASDKVRVYNRKRMDANRELIQEWVNNNGGGCIVCNETEMACIDFHHVDPLTKTKIVSTMLNYKWDVILEELEKCVPLCSNCHRKHHYCGLELPKC